jgi:hypothetical protein
MESISEAIQVVFIGAAFALLGILVSRRRQHLRLVVRVIDSKDQELIGFLDDLVTRGELAPATVA